MAIGWIVAGGAALLTGGLVVRGRGRTRRLQALQTPEHLRELAMAARASLERARQGSPAMLATSQKFGVGCKFVDKGDKGHQYDLYFGYRGGSIDLKQAHMRMSFFVCELLKPNACEFQLIPGYDFSLFGVRHDPPLWGDIDAAIRTLQTADFDEE